MLVFVLVFNALLDSETSCPSRLQIPSLTSASQKSLVAVLPLSCLQLNSIFHKAVHIICAMKAKAIIVSGSDQFSVNSPLVLCIQLCVEARLP